VKHEDKTTAALEAEIAILERKKLITEEQIALRRRELARRSSLRGGGEPGFGDGV